MSLNLNDYSEDILRFSAIISDVQQKYDAIGWEKRETSKSDLNHIQLHLAKALGKVATVCEKWDHNTNATSTIDQVDENDILNDVIADLIHYSSQIASIKGINLGEAIIDRYNRNIKMHSD